MLAVRRIQTGIKAGKMARCTTQSAQYQGLARSVWRKPLRHFGFLANGHRRSRLVLIRQAIAATVTMRTYDDQAGRQEPKRPSRLAFDPALCPCCGGAMRVIAILPRCQPCPDTS